MQRQECIQAAKGFVVLWLCAIFVILWTASGRAAYVNNIPYLSSSTQTPVALGSVTPVPVVQCGAQLSGNQTGYYIANEKICCRNAAAAKVFYNWGAPVYATPCPTASPAPNVSTPSGGEMDLIQIQPSLFQACMTYGASTYGNGNSYLNGELDMVSNVGGTTCTSEVQP